MATLLVLAGGYGWLGFAADGGLGALVGCAAGLVTGALLHFLVNSAVSGTSMRRRPRRSRRTSPRPVR
ncbi:hypothetical protein [Streptomyces sp. NPDC090083]|uniref:hypothetical protein n=1 Tax=Streptomyces sp. NPDC090083 TaxID=3365941 RepID=UPI003815C2DC